MTSQTEEPAQPGLYIGGLRNDLHPGKMAGLICSLLWKFKVQVAKQFVHVNLKGNKAYAIVELPDVSVSKYLLTQLSSDNVQNVFNLSTITFNPSHFKVGPKLTNNRRYRSQSRPNQKDDRDRSAVESSSNTTQNSSSNHSVDTAGRYRSRSRSYQRNDVDRLRMGSASNTAQASASNHSMDSDSMPVMSKREARRRRKRNRSETNEARTSQPGSSYTVTCNPSITSRQSVESQNSSPPEDEVMSESDNDSSPVSKDVSSCSTRTKDSDSKGERSVDCLVPRGTKLQALGVQRLLAEEFSVDPLGKSLSDCGLHLPVGKTTVTTSTTGLPHPSRVSVTTSTPGAGQGLVSNFYRLGQTMGRETHHSEFKQGGIIHKDRSWLLETVGKYVCGFLNSAEGGTLYIGVSDKGEVTGFTCPQSKEDSYRLVIDDALKGIEPPIFTDVYTVRFIPVMEPSGHISDTQQVLEVEVKEIRNLKHLYTFRGNAFLRRDGSLQGPLKAQQVQEWTRKKLERENSSSLLKSQLREMSTQLAKEHEQRVTVEQQLREQLEREQEQRSTMEQQLQDLEHCISEVKLKQRKSKICAMM